VFISSSAAENNMARPLHYQADECLIESISIDEIVKIIDNSIDSRLQSDRKHILAIGDLLLNKVSYQIASKRDPLSRPIPTLGALRIWADECAAIRMGMRRRWCEGGRAQPD
jgi:hypothetical protein